MATLRPTTPSPRSTLEPARRRGEVARDSAWDVFLLIETQIPKTSREKKKAIGHYSRSNLVGVDFCSTSRRHVIFAIWDAGDGSGEDAFPKRFWSSRLAKKMILLVGWAGLILSGHLIALIRISFGLWPHWAAKPKKRPRLLDCLKSCLVAKKYGIFHSNFFRIMGSGNLAGYTVAKISSRVVTFCMVGGFDHFRTSQDMEKVGTFCLWASGRARFHGGWGQNLFLGSNVPQSHALKTHLFSDYFLRSNMK